MVEGVKEAEGRGEVEDHGEQPDEGTNGEVRQQHELPHEGEESVLPANIIILFLHQILLQVQKSYLVATRLRWPRTTLKKEMKAEAKKSMRPLSSQTEPKKPVG